MAPWDDIRPDSTGLVVVERPVEEDLRYGYCRCGCGQKPLPAPQTRTGRGWVRGEPMPYVRSHSGGPGAKRRAKLVWRVAENDCWEWQGRVNAGGYGRTSFLGKRDFAHRVVLRLSGIDIPKGMHTDHLCRNTRCVNPKHLEVVPCHINVRRGSRAKLTEGEYIAFEERARSTSAWDFAALAEEFGLQPEQAYGLIHRASQREQSERTTQEVLA